MSLRPNGEGSGMVAPNPSFVTHQPACKPGSVGHRRRAPTMRDGHSSGIALARDLEQPTRTVSPTSLFRTTSLSPRTVRICRPYSVLLPVGFAVPVPLPDPRCALTAPFHPCSPSRLASRRRAVRSLWHFPWGCPRRMLSGTACRWSPDFPLQAAFRRVRERPSGRLMPHSWGLKATTSTPRSPGKIRQK